MESQLKMKKVSKYWTLIEVNGIASALFNSKTHTVYYNYYHRPDCGVLPVNSFIELSSDEFYNKLEKLTK